MIRSQHRIFAVVFSVCVLIGVPIAAVASANCGILPVDLEGEGEEEAPTLVIVGNEIKVAVTNPIDNADITVVKEGVSDKDILELKGDNCEKKLKPGEKCEGRKLKCIKSGKASWIVTVNPDAASSSMLIECHDAKGLLILAPRTFSLDKVFLI